MQLDDFISAIGYDGDSAIIDKLRKSKNKGKTISNLLDEGSFRAATAYAVFSDSEENLQLVADRYNQISGSNYKKEQMVKLFGVSKITVKKQIFL